MCAWNQKRRSIYYFEMHTKRTLSYDQIEHFPWRVSTMMSYVDGLTHLRNVAVREANGYNLYSGMNRANFCI